MQTSQITSTTGSARTPGQHTVTGPTTSELCPLLISPSTTSRPEGYNYPHQHILYLPRQRRLRVNESGAGLTGGSAIVTQVTKTVLLDLTEGSNHFRLALLDP